MKIRQTARVLFLLFFLLVPASGQAHRLKVFATAVGERIEGSAYFAGGAMAPGIPITIESPPGTPLTTVTTGPEGAFTHVATTQADHRVVARTGDGHQADYLIAAAELSATLPKGATPSPAAPQETRAQGDTPLTLTVEEAVARQIAPLRRQLDAMEAQTRLRDILGGLGYIAGLMGLAMWWGTRRKKPPKDSP